MKTLKLVGGFLLVSLLSAGVAIGTYSYLNKGNGSYFFNNPINQQGFRAVGYATPAENTDFTYAAEQSVNAVVHIKSVAKPSERSRGGNRYLNPFDFFFGDGDSNPFQPYQNQPKVGFGSGVIISSDGYIVTNNHVIEGADEIEVKTNDDKVYKAKVIGNDDLTDVALIKIDGKDLHTLPFGDSEQIKVGEWVLAVGNPFNLTSTVTAGIISAKGRSDVFYGYDPDGSAQQKIQSYIQTDAAVNPGNSGGALVNTKGELIGINSMIYSQTGSFVGYSFAVPINIVKKVISDLKQYGAVQRAMLGINISDLSELKELKEDNTKNQEYKDVIANAKKINLNDGVYVRGFSSNSSAQKAGIQVGDVITAINGTKVKTGQELRGQLGRYSPGDKIDVQVYRKDATKNYTIELKNDQGTTDVIKQKSPDDILGATFKELSQDMKTKVDINYGIEVTDLSNGKLKSAGIKKGFIILQANDNRISSSDDLQSIVSEIMKNDPDDRGLYIKGFYPDSRRMEYYAIDLNN
jgi:Do/DeqQ family serine protease